MSDTNPLIMDRISEIGEYLHCEKPNEAQRQWALEKYFDLYDSLQNKGGHENGKECLGPGCIYCDEEEAKI